MFYLLWACTKQLKYLDMRILLLLNSMFSTIVFFFFLTNQFCPILMGQNWPVFTFRLEYLLLSFFGIKYIIKVGWSCTMVECALWTFPVKENLFIKLQICCNPVFKNPLSNLIDLILKNTSCSEKQAY